MALNDWIIRLACISGNGLQGVIVRKYHWVRTARTAALYLEVRAHREHVKAAQIHHEECQPQEVTVPLIGQSGSCDHFPSGVSTTAGSRAAETHRFFAK